MPTTDAERIHPGIVAGWSHWLAAKHSRREGVWVVGRGLEAESHVARIGERDRHHGVQVAASRLG